MKYVEIKNADKAYAEQYPRDSMMLYCYSADNNPDGPNDGTIFASFECRGKQNMSETISSIRSLAYVIAGGEDAVAFTVKEEFTSAPEEGPAEYKYTPFNEIGGIGLHHYNYAEQTGKPLSIENLHFIRGLEADQDSGYSNAHDTFCYLGNVPVNYDLGFALVVFNSQDDSIQILDCGMDDFDAQWQKIFTNPQPTNGNSEPTNPMSMQPRDNSVKIQFGDDDPVIKEIQSLQAAGQMNQLTDYTVTNVVKVSATSKEDALQRAAQLDGVTYLTDGTGYPKQID